MLDLVWYSIFNIRFECLIEFDIRYLTFDLNVGFSLIFDIQHSIWMWDWVWYSIFDIQNLNVRLSLIFDIRHSIWMLDLVWYSIFNIRFECWIEFDIRYSTFKIWMLNVEYRTSNQILIAEKSTKTEFCVCNKMSCIVHHTLVRRCTNAALERRKCRDWCAVNG